MGSEYLGTSNKKKKKKQRKTSDAVQLCYRNKYEEANHKDKMFRLTSYQIQISANTTGHLPCDNNVDLKEMSCMPTIPRQISINYFIHGHFTKKKKKNLPEVW